MEMQLHCFFAVSLLYTVHFPAIAPNIDYIKIRLEKFHLTHFSPVSRFYNPWKRQKTFSGVIEMWHWTKMG